MGKPLALIVDDHFDSAVIFSEALKWAGFDTEVAYSGEAALARLAALAPDVVVLDLCLPRVAGVDILRRIRDDPRLAKTLVVIATADTEAADALGYGAADVMLVKPIGFSQLRQVAAGLIPNVSKDVTCSRPDARA